MSKTSPGFAAGRTTRRLASAVDVAMVGLSHQAPASAIVRPTSHPALFLHPQDHPAAARCYSAGSAARKEVRVESGLGRDLLGLEGQRVQVPSGELSIRPGSHWSS